MLPNYKHDKYPRKLTELEKLYIRKLLPSNKPGYKTYSDKLENIFLIGLGRFQQHDYVLGKQDDQPDFSAPAESMLAVGVINTLSHKIELSIHYEFENKIELDFAVSGEGEFKQEIINYWTYSDWLPGKNSPPDNSRVREIHLIKNKVVIVIARESKRVWVYEEETGVNHIVPATNFYNEIMRVKNIRDPKIALNPKRLFTHIEELSDEEIAQGFLMYNKYLNKIKIDYSLFAQKKEEKKKSFFKIFGGRKN